MAPRKKLFQDGKVDNSVSSKTPTKKLSSEEIDNLARDYETKPGVTQRSLAENYKVSKSQVNRALLKKKVKIRKENEGRVKSSDSKASGEKQTTKGLKTEPSSADNDEKVIYGAKKLTPKVSKLKPESADKATKTPGKDNQLPPNGSNSATKHINVSTPLQYGSESSDESNSEDGKSLRSFDNIEDLGEFFAKETNEEEANDDPNVSQNINSRETDIVNKIDESKAEHSGTTEIKNDRDMNATSEKSKDQLEHAEFKEYANWYVRYNIAEREKMDRKYKFIVGEYQTEATKRKRLELESEKKDEQITNLTHRNKHLKHDYDQAVSRGNTISQKYEDLLKETKHHRSSKNVL